MSDEKKYDFFISYTGVDAQWAAWINRILIEANYKTFRDQANLVVGYNWPQELKKAQKISKHVLAVLSPDYFDANITHIELNSAEIRAAYEKSRVLIPVKVRECDLGEWDNQIHYLNLVGKTADECIDAILKTARGEPLVDDRDAPIPDELLSPQKPAANTSAPKILLREKRNDDFSGRQEDLKRLHASIATSSTTAITQAITGGGGIGKTELAKQYTYEYESDYTLIGWMHAESPESRATDFHRLAKAMGLADDATPQDQALHAVLANLAQLKDWLLVFDNVESPEDLKGALPDPLTGHVLITTRYQFWDHVASTFAIDKFEPAESLEYLKKVLPGEDDVMLNDLAVKVDHYPLALAQATAYMKFKKLPLAEFLEEYAAREKLVRQFRNPHADYSLSIETTTLLSVDRLVNINPKAVDVLNVFAFLDAEKIPVDLFKPEADCLGMTPIEFHDAVADLDRLSLVKYDEQTHDATIHRLVQAVARDKMGEDGCKKFLAAALRLLAEAFPWSSDLYDITNWPASWRLIPHARAVLDRIEGTADDEVSHWRLCLHAGKFLHAVVLYREAEPLLQKAYKIANVSTKIEKLDLAITCNEFANFLNQAGRHAEAVSLYEQARDLYEIELGPDHPNVAATLNNLAELYRAQGKYDQAEPLYQRALKIVEKALGPEHPEVANTLNNLAGLYQDQGKYGQAEPLYQRALKIVEKALGTDHPHVAQSLNNLAALYDAQGKYDQAEALFQRALKIWEKALGPDHPDIAITLNNLAALYQAQGKYDQAETLYQRSLKIREEKLGPDHPDVAQSLNNLAGLYFKLNKLETAEPYLRRVVVIFEKALPANHPHLAVVYGNYAVVLAALNRHQEAAEYEAKAEHIRAERKRLGLDGGEGE